MSVCGHVHIWIYRSHTGLLVATKKELTLPCWLHALTQCGAVPQSTHQSHLVSSLIWAPLVALLLYPLAMSGHLTMSCLLWSSLVVGSKEWLHRPPRSPSRGLGHTADLAPKHSICSYNLQSTSSLYGLILIVHTHINTIQ